MARWIFAVLFAFVLASPLAISVWTNHHIKLRQSDLQLVVITPHQESIRREFAQAFARYYQDNFHHSVTVDYRSFGASDIVKMFDERSKTTFKTTGTYDVDIAWGGGDFLFDVQLKKPGYLEPLPLDPPLLALLRDVYPQPTLSGLPLYDPDTRTGPCWFGTALSSFGIVYNRDVCRHLGIPDLTTWRDLADPRLAGWICLADPTRSASAKQAYMVIVERAMADAVQHGQTEDSGWADGMGMLRLISANARFFTDSSTVVPIMVSQGDAAAGTAIDFYGRSQTNAVGDRRMGYVEPENATIINPDPIAMVKGAPHRELAEQFIRFILSRQGQLLWNTRPGVPGGPRDSALRRLPIRRDMYGQSDLANYTDQVNPFVAASSFNKSNAREATFPIMGELMQASCIDLLDELVATRKAILASPRAAELDAKLARFPFDQKEAIARMKAYKSASVARRLELLRDWTQQFRAEYAGLRAEAAAR